MNIVIVGEGVVATQLFDLCGEAVLKAERVALCDLHFPDGFRSADWIIEATGLDPSKKDPILRKIAAQSFGKFRYQRRVH